MLEYFYLAEVVGCDDLQVPKTYRWRRMTTRLTFGLALAIAIAFFWQATTLPRWDMFGPGPGLFPVIVSTAAAVFACLLVLFPSMGGEVTFAMDEEPMAPAEQRVFVAYALALPALIIGAYFLGFIGTSIVLALAISFYVEGRNWPAALAFGVFTGLGGVVIFHHYLDTPVPIGWLDSVALRLVR